jgi:uncharacterized coiled-coil protein SlyX
MKDRIEECARQAAQARTFAEGDSTLKEEWLSVAAMWEELAAEYKKLAAARQETARKEKRQ